MHYHAPALSINKHLVFNIFRKKVTYRCGDGMRESLTYRHIFCISADRTKAVTPERQ
jgi:hypothetical protein